MTGKLIEFICPKCKKHLAWASKSSSVYCKKCDKWITGDKIKHLNPARMDPERNQLILFDD